MTSNQVNQYGGGVEEPFWAHYTAKNINATDGSRTAIDDNIAVGDIVILDPYQFDGYPTSGAKPRNVTRPQTSFLHMQKYLVLDVSASVNEIPLASAATQRRGGAVLVTPAADEVTASVDGTTDVSVGDRLEVTNGSFNLTKRAALTTVSTSLTFAYAGTPDYAIANAVPSNSAAGFAFASNDEFGAVLTVLANAQTRIAELASLIGGGVCAVAHEAYTTNSAALKRVRFNGRQLV